MKLTNNLNNKKNIINTINNIQTIFMFLICLSTYFIIINNTVTTAAFAQSEEIFAFYERAMRAYEKADYKNAETYFSNIIKNAPDSTYGNQAAFYLGRTLIKLNREKEALELWQSYYDKNMFIGRRAELFKLYEKFGLLESKLNEFKEKVKKDPASYQIRHEYIELLIYTNRVDEAVAQYDFIYSQRPSDFYILKNSGDLLVKFKRYKEALYYFEKLLKLQPENELYLESAGNAYYQLGDKIKAREIWFKIIAQNPPPHKYSALAGILQSHNMLDEAINVYSAGKKNSGNPSLFFSELAELYEVKNDYKNLIIHYFEIIDMMPVMYTAIEQRLAETLKRNEESREPLCRLLTGEFKNDISNNPYKLKLAALIFLISKKYNETLELNLSLAKITSNPVIIEDYARTLYSLELFDLSLLALDAISRAYPESAHEYNARYLKARFLKAQRRYKEAVEIFETIKNDRKFSTFYNDSLFNIAQIYFDGLNLKKEAIEIFAGLVKNSPNYRYDSLYYISAFDAYNARYDSAEIILKELLAQKNHKNAAASYTLDAYLKIYRGSFEIGLENLREVVSDYPSCEKNNDIFKTIKIIIENQKDGQQDLSLFFKAEREFYAGRFDTAENILSELAAKKNPLKYEAMRMIYKIQFHAGRFNKFIEAVKAYTAEEPDNQLCAEALYDLASYYYQNDKNNIEAAVICLETILKKYPGALLSNKSKKMLSAIKGDDKIDHKTRNSFFGYN